MNLVVSSQFPSYKPLQKLTLFGTVDGLCSGGASPGVSGYVPSALAEKRGEAHTVSAHTMPGAAQS